MEKLSKLLGSHRRDNEEELRFPLGVFLTTCAIFIASTSNRKRRLHVMRKSSRKDIRRLSTLREFKGFSEVNLHKESRNAT
jgi:hypothetical protein